MSLEYMSLEQRESLAALADQLSNDPNTREDFLRLTQKVKPDLTIPELKIKDELRYELDATKKELESWKSKQMERDAVEEWQQKRQNLIDKGKVSKADIAEIEKIMVDKKIHDHETAADYWQWMKEAAVPTTDSSIGYRPSVMSNFNLTNFMKNPVQGARNEAHQALMELKKNSRPIGI